MILIREWFAEWAQSFYVRHGYDPVNRLANVLCGVLILGALTIVAAHSFS